MERAVVQVAGDAFKVQAGAEILFTSPLHTSVFEGLI
jgi:hypothetical protein